MNKLLTMVLVCTALLSCMILTDYATDASFDPSPVSTMAVLTIDSPDVQTTFEALPDPGSTIFDPGIASMPISLTLNSAAYTNAMSAPACNIGYPGST